MAIDVTENVNRFNNELKAWLDVSGVANIGIQFLLPFLGKLIIEWPLVQAITY